MSAIALLGVFGAAIGSFVNVLAYRLPRRESLVKPRSRCPQLRHEDRALRQHPGRLVARCCAAAAATATRAISVRYPLVEALTAALFVAVGLKFGLEPELFPALAFAVTLVAAAATDLEHRIIPNRLMAPAAVAAVALWAVIDPSPAARRT